MVGVNSDATKFSSRFPQNIEKGWVIPVTDFNSEEALTQGKTFDSDISQQKNSQVEPKVLIKAGTLLKLKVDQDRGVKAGSQVEVAYDFYEGEDHISVRAHLDSAIKQRLDVKPDEVEWPEKESSAIADITKNSRTIGRDLKVLIALVIEKAKSLSFDDFTFWWADNFILKSGNQESGKAIVRHFGIPENSDTAAIYKAAKNYSSKEEKNGNDNQYNFHYRINSRTGEQTENVIFDYNGTTYNLAADADGYGFYGMFKNNEVGVTFFGRKEGKAYQKIYEEILPALKEWQKSNKGTVTEKHGNDDEKFDELKPLKLSDIPAIVKQFMPEFQQKAIVGSEEHKEILADLEKIIREIPKLYATEKLGFDEKTIYLHYFYGGSDWYIAEKGTGEDNYAFGYAILNGDLEMAEWGNISIEEIKELNKIELDFFWTPKKFSEVKKKWERKAEPDYEFVGKFGNSLDLVKFSDGTIAHEWLKKTGLEESYDVRRITVEDATDYQPIGFYGQKKYDNKTFLNKGVFESNLSQNTEKVSPYFGDRITRPLRELGFDVNNDGSSVDIYYQGKNFNVQDNSRLKFPYARHSFTIFLNQEIEIGEIVEGDYGSITELADLIQTKIFAYIHKSEGGRSVIEDTPDEEQTIKRIKQPDYLFIGGYPGGTVYSDKTRQEHGDYKSIAFVQYSPLEFKVYDNNPKYNDALEIAKSEYAELYEKKFGQNPYDLSNRENIPIEKIREEAAGLYPVAMPEREKAIPEQEEFHSNIGKVAMQSKGYNNMGDYKSYIEEATGKQLLSLTEEEIIAQLKELPANKLLGNGSKEVKVNKIAQMLVYAFTKNVEDNKLTLEQYAIKKFIGSAYTEAAFESEALWVPVDEYKAAWERAKSPAEFSVGDRVIFTAVSGKEFDVNFRGYTVGNTYGVIVGRSGSGIDQMSVPISQLKKITEESPSLIEAAKQSPNIIIASVPKVDFTLTVPVEKSNIRQEEPKVAESYISKYKGKPQHQINQAIKQLLDEKGIESANYSADEIAFLKLYEGAGGLAKQGATGARLFDQFFTPNDIIAKMWGIAIKHGFSFGPGKSIIEPAMGSGRFFAYIPKGIKMNVVGYDIEEVSYKICKVLYPDYDLRLGSFESMFFQGRRHIGLVGVTQFYDLVIGNPPYREYTSEYAPLGEKDATGAPTFEAYFITRGVDILKPGGLLVMIIPNTFLSNDSKYNELKDKLIKKADFVDAYRLPNGVFGNTDVGTDIIVLRKK